MKQDYLNGNSSIGQGRDEKQIESNDWCATASAFIFGLIIIALIIYAGFNLFINK